MHGKGSYTWKDGRKYEGEYLHDKKHGDGMYIWADGRKYDGQWAYGKQHGKGKYILPDGIVRVGIWEDGKRIQWLDETPNVTMQNTQNGFNSGRGVNNFLAGSPNNSSPGLSANTQENSRPNFSGSEIKVNEATNQLNYPQSSYNANPNAINSPNVRY